MGFYKVIGQFLLPPEVGTCFAFLLFYYLKALQALMTATAILQRLHESRLGSSLAESLYMYPLVEGTHLLSLVFSIGLLFVIDLRLIGAVFADIAIDSVLAKLRPWILSGFLFTLVTGFLLTATTGPKLLDNFIFPLKLLLIVAAALNAVLFEVRYGKYASHWVGLGVPSGAKLAGWVSLISWTLVIILGRLIPYYDGN